MKYSAKKSVSKYKKWHSWYAWYPVRIEKTWFWLKVILRRDLTYKDYSILERIFGLPEYEYKESIFDLIKSNK